MDLSICRFALAVVLAIAPVAAQWQRIPLVKQSTLTAGFVGGEGAQWPRALAISDADPSFMLFATDVGGIYRSFDGGLTWATCMVGWNSRGGNGFAIDPRNASHVIGIGGNSNDFGTVNGLYLSTDRASSWKQVLPMPDAVGGSLAFDPSSFDQRSRMTLVAYFASSRNGIWKTIDGGSTWAQASSAPSNSRIAVHPTRGYVYAVNKEAGTTGFWRSSDGGSTFQRISPDADWGIAVVASQPDMVWVSRSNGVFVSNDAGTTFTAVANRGLEGGPIENLAVSPANPKNMTCWYQGDNYFWRKYYSTDGGNNWTLSQVDSTNAFLPFNVRNGIWAWHPRNPNEVWGVGGDWITKSTDAGATFRWASNGEAAIMVGSGFMFSALNPDMVLLAAQDYNGAFTADGGHTWTYENISGYGWGGYTYGGFAVDGRNMWAGNATGWTGPRTLTVSRDGGATWAAAKDSRGQALIFSGPDVSYGDPTNADVGFASNYRTTDRGATWSAMNGCDAVYTYNSANANELFGKHGSDLVHSNDHGLTWTAIVTVPGGITDIAYDPGRNRFYFASEDRLKQYDSGGFRTLDTPADQYGARRVVTVALDPADPAVVYAGSHADIYACNNSVVRSTDAGATWTNLALNAVAEWREDAPHEVSWIRVHPVTRDAWVAGQCYGMFRIHAPGTARENRRPGRGQ